MTKIMEDNLFENFLPADSAKKLLLEFEALIVNITNIDSYEYALKLTKSLKAQIIQSLEDAYWYGNSEANNYPVSI